MGASREGLSLTAQPGGAEVVTGRTLLRDRAFRALFAAQTVSQLGDRVSDIAFPLIGVLVLHASAGQVSLLTALLWLPQVLSPLVGAWADRRDRKKPIMVAADLARTVVLLSVPAAYAMGRLTLGHLFVVAALAGCGTVLFNSGWSAFFVKLVRREDYLTANSLLSGSRSASYVVGPSVGGGLVQLLTAPWAVVADAVSFLASAAFLTRIEEPCRSRDPDEAAAPTEGLLRETRHGLAFLVRDRVLRATLGCATTANFFSFVYVALVVVFASRELGLRSGLIGLALGVGSVGGLLGAVLAPRLSRRIGVGPTVVVGGLVFPAAIGIAAVAQGPDWLRFGMLALSELVSGLGVMAFDVNLNSVFTSVIPDELRSRVVGSFAAVNYGARPLGALTGGLLAGWIGLRPTFWVATVGGMLCVLWLLPSPVARIRSLSDLPAPRAPTDRSSGQSSGRSSSA